MTMESGMKINGVRLTVKEALSYCKKEIKKLQAEAKVCSYKDHSSNCDSITCYIKISNRYKAIINLEKIENEMLTVRNAKVYDRLTLKADKLRKLI